MVTTISNFTAITKKYALGEVDSRHRYVFDKVKANNTEAWTKGQILNYNFANNYYEVADAADVVTRTAVALEDKATTATRALVLLQGIVCVETTTVLVENDSIKYAAAGTAAKWDSGVDAANLMSRSIYMKIASKIDEGIGKAVTNSGTTDPTNKVLVWINAPHA